MTDTKITDRFQAVGKRIKALRVEAGYTSYETFAIEHNLARKSYWDWEKGSNYKFETLIRIIDIHGITLEEFFKGLE
jgi:transcriptional regulator with XRE-family HTH domain